ncbi:uncharacterized protein LOC130986669 [Salvia miltiorrhiza]|uniref:uncharacterized protein LOC130986669 n=1 Tax=Salvia miltiorrhiza TaxID=226208 RepID=UPI0025AC7922|nr:uncharacterized protein LOC130986669 [Salvia miltiorrhiza]
MKPIPPRPILTLSILTAANHKATKIPHVVAFSTLQSHHHLRRQEEESRAVRVSVWWDFENCHVPVNGNAFRVAQSITNAIRANGIKGPIEITAFGDVMQISRTNQEALSATGINLTHVPSGGKNSADRSLLVDLMYWVSKNPPPAHLLLISGDRDFAGILHRLRMSNYNILLASPDSAPNVLCSAATIMWHWSSLLKGENLSGKLFNQPPDGPYNSWYGHYKAPLVDPFAVTVQSTCSSADQSSLLASEPKLLAASEPKIRPIPKAVMKHISQILRSNPEGVSIIDLRAELAKSNVDKDLYGYRKFSRFLLAMPHILELHRDDGSIVVRHVNTKFSNELSASEEPGTANGESEVCGDTKTNSQKSSCENVADKSTVGQVSGPKVKAELTKLQEAPKVEKKNESSVATKMHDVKMEARAANLKEAPNVEKQNDYSVSMKMHDVKLETHAANLQDVNNEKNQKASLPKKNIQEDRTVKPKTQPHKDEVTPATPVVEVKDLSENNENNMLVPDDRSSAAGFGIFRRIWMKLFGSTDAKHNDALSGKEIDTQETFTTCQSSETVGPALFSPSSHEALLNGKVAQNGEVADHLQVSIKQLDESREEKNGEAVHVDAESKQLEIFAEESIWKEIESFISSSQGSAVFSKSQWTRKHLAQNLQNQGPMVLRLLSISDLLHIIDLLISDKKWLEERGTGRYPFRVAYPARKPLQNNRPLSSSGLSHIFSDRQPSSQESKERKHQNHPHTGVPQPIVHRGSSSKSKTEVLADCKKLVDEIVKEYPEGFNVGGFSKLFLEKYGYAPDLQMLGLEKFTTLLKIMPGAVVASNLILPRGASKNLNLQNTGLPIQETKTGPVVDSHGDSSIISKQDDESDSWDELGPLDTSGSEKDEMEAQVTGKSRKGTDMGLPFYEPLREDDFSDSEDEMSSDARSEDESKSNPSSESALLDILDSWHSQKEGKSKRDESTSKNGLDLSATCSSKKGSEVGKPTRKSKLQKNYTFVKEVDSKDRLINGILGSMNKCGDKSGDSKVLS